MITQSCSKMWLQVDIFINKISLPSSMPQKSQRDQLPRNGPLFTSALDWGINISPSQSDSGGKYCSKIMFSII